MTSIQSLLATGERDLADHADGDRGRTYATPEPL
jgi:hypothetical protein